MSERCFDILDTSLTLGSCVLYVLSTYVERDSQVQTALEFGMWVTEVVISAALLSLYLRRLFCAASLLDFARSPSSLLDLATSAPVLLFLLVLSTEDARWVRILRVLRVLRTFGLTAELQARPVAQQTLTVGLTIVSVIYISTCIFPFLEAGLDAPPEEAFEAFPWHDMLYFVIITITTVGFGDITPATTQGRLFCLAMVATTFVLLPLQTSKLIELISARDPLAARFAPSRHRPHVIVFGSPSAATLQHFAAQLPQQLLVLSPDEPSEQARAPVPARPLRHHPHARHDLTPGDLARSGLPSRRAVCSTSKRRRGGCTGCAAPRSLSRTSSARRRGAPRRPSC